MSSIVITGAAGFIGSHTAEKFLAAGHRVIGLDNFRTGHRSNLSGILGHENFAFHEIDVAADGALGNLVAKYAPSAIVHLAGLVSVQESIANPQLNYRLNIHATQLVAEAARQHGVPRIVFASSAATYGRTEKLPLEESGETRPISPYGAAKLASENLLLGHAEAYHFTVRCQRYFNVYGPRQDPASPYSGVLSLFARGFRENKPVTVYGDGRQTRDFIAVGDVAQANVLAATKANLTSGIANICTGRSTSLQEILAIFSARFPTAPLPMHAPARLGDILHSSGHPSKAQAELGFIAETKIETGLAQIINDLAS
ncbi:MAG TPA: NAD-dependent epimerase/dehydratase family protein [Opitutaceae bacterium]|nr:NAD-dependent epimerase/dehydratase family protein [Opitutaceae bacterium]